MGRPARIAVLGSGLGAALSSVWFARLLKRAGTEIVQVPAGPATAAPVLATLPSFDAVHTALGFDLRDMVRTTGSCFRLGTEYVSTGGFHVYGDVGAAFGAVPFHLVWRAHSENVSAGSFTQCSLAALAARTGRFAPPLEGGPPGSAFSPGLHLNGPAYLDYLQHAAQHYGVRIAAPLASAHDAELGGAVDLADGTRLNADLIIDTAGSVADPDWRPALALPPSLQVFWGRADTRQPLGTARLRNVAGNIAIDTALESDLFRALIVSSEAAAHRATSVLRREGFTPLDAQYRALSPGWSPAPWKGRVVRIGDAACQLPPVEAAELRLVQIGLETLGELLPGGSNSVPERAEYNRRVGEAYAALADFVSVPFLSADGKAQGLPESLALRARNFTSRGRIILLDGESLTRDSWASLFIACGWRMERADAHAAALPADRVRASIAGIAATLAASCETLPDQRTFLRRAGLALVPAGGAGA